MNLEVNLRPVCCSVAGFVWLTAAVVLIPCGGGPHGQEQYLRILAFECLGSRSAKVSTVIRWN